VTRESVDLVSFEKGQRKDDVAHDYLAGFGGEEGVLFVGKAQEKTTTFRTEKRRNAETGASYPWIVRATAMVNQYYIYCVDRDFGPFFIKFSSYFPYNAKLCINGNEWAKRQGANAGIAFQALDNGFASCEDPWCLQRICDRLSAAKIDALARKWFRMLPHPFTGRDRRAGYRYDISILRAEFSLTQVLDRPLTGRVFFEDVIRENLNLGRPDQVALIFNKPINRRTPSRFRTRVITEGVTPSLHVCTSTTSIPGSSSITSRTGRCAPRRQSTTPATSESADACITSPRCGRSASKPTDVCLTSNESARTATSANKRVTASANPSSSISSAQLRCASATLVSKRCSASWSSSASCPPASPTETCEPTSHHCRASIPAS
jgi:hypothetical protein